MILRSRARPQALLQALLKPSFSRQQGQRRFEHTVPELPPIAKDFARLGIDGFLTPRGFEINWTTYQQHLCDILNQTTEGSVDENLSTEALVGKYAHSPQHASLFNYASKALNNHLFFKTLAPHTTNPSTSFQQEINTNFDSLDNLRQEMLESADAMFGNGFVWLMKERGAGNLRILCTYNAGSPLPEAHYRQQSRNMATEPNEIASRLSRPQNFAGNFGEHSKNRVPHMTNALLADPILCVNVWQQMWMLDYGLIPKKTYLQCWWERINWPAVEQAANDVDAKHGQNYMSSGLGRAVSQSFNRW